MDLVILGVSIILGASGHVLAKVATTQMTKGSFIGQLVTNIWVYGAVAAYGFSFIFWFGYLRGRNLSRAVPMSALTYVLVAILGMVFFRERLLPAHWFGLVMIIVGVTMLGR